MSTTSEGVDAKLAAFATELAAEVVDCDPSILSLLVLDGTGRVLAVRRSSRLAESDYVEAQVVPKFGAIAKVIMGAANNATPFMGELDFLVGAFKKQKVVLYNLHEREITLALRLSRSANGEYVCQRIEDTIATRKNVA